MVDLGPLTPYLSCATAAHHPLHHLSHSVSAKYDPMLYKTQLSHMLGQEASFPLRSFLEKLRSYE